MRDSSEHEVKRIARPEPGEGHAPIKMLAHSAPKMGLVLEGSEVLDQGGMDGKGELWILLEDLFAKVTSCGQNRSILAQIRHFELWKAALFETIKGTRTSQSEVNFGYFEAIVGSDHGL